MGRRTRSGRWLGILLATVVAGALVLATPAGAQDLAGGDDAPARHADIRIESDEDFNPANGVRSGSGTRSDPFVISGWDVGRIFIRDTDSYFVIRDNVIRSQLTLNWNGDRVRIVDNEIGDLRVNQNVKRTGEATSGLIARNNIGVVGQLRHFDGVFERNVVNGNNPNVFGEIFDERAVNFDGFNGAKFRDNIIYGYMDARLHGHHHSSDFDEGSHYHGADHAEHSHDAGMHVDHSRRYHRVQITNNRIYSDSEWALRYTDTAHSANDRTAASETDEALNAPHVHFTRVLIANNKLAGSGLWIDVFNADDRNHTGTERGVVRVASNRIELKRETDEWPWSAEDGIRVQSAKDVTLRIADNFVTGESPQERDLLDEYFTYGSGVSLYHLEDADIFITGNEVAHMIYGVEARQMNETVQWWIRNLSTTGVDQAVYYDNSVENHPDYNP